MRWIYPDTGDRVWIGSTTTKDRKSTRLNSSHSQISYAVFCLKKKKKTKTYAIDRNLTIRPAKSYASVRATQAATTPGELSDTRHSDHRPGQVHVLRYTSMNQD